MSGTITPPPGTIADLESHENWKKAAAVVKMVKASQVRLLLKMFSINIFILLLFLYIRSYTVQYECTIANFEEVIADGCSSYIFKLDYF